MKSLKATPLVQSESPVAVQIVALPKPAEQVDIRNFDAPSNKLQVQSTLGTQAGALSVRPESPAQTSFADMVAGTPSSFGLELGPSGQIVMMQESGDPTENQVNATLSSPSIDGFLTRFLSASGESSDSNKLPASERLVTDDQTFPSLEPGTRHQVSRKAKPEGYPDRGQVPDNWGPDYKPITYLDTKVAAGPNWAEKTDFNEAVAGRIEAVGLDPSDPKAQDIQTLFPSYESSQIVDGKPRNPRGPTGITGQGLLGKHGANSAADPVVFRRHKDPETGETKLQMIAIQRRDNGNWAIPGGMTDFGESVSGTLGRELREEALGGKATPEQAERFDENFKTLFDEKGSHVYRGAVDDFRNTDTSWMETSVKMVELTEADAEKIGWDMNLTAGDDAVDAKWMDVNAANLKTLNANHGDFVGKSVQVWQKQTGVALNKDGVVCASS